MLHENRVKDTSTTTGTGDLTLSGSPPTGFRAFSVHGTGSANTFEYVITTSDSSEWEVGIGYLSAATTLVRSVILKSSNADAAVNFSAGTKTVISAVSGESLASFQSVDRQIVTATGTYTESAVLSGKTVLFQSVTLVGSGGGGGGGANSSSPGGGGGGESGQVKHFSYAGRAILSGVAVTIGASAAGGAAGSGGNGSAGTGGALTRIDAVPASSDRWEAEGGDLGSGGTTTAGGSGGDGGPADVRVADYSAGGDGGRLSAAEDGAEYSGFAGGANGGATHSGGGGGGGAIDTPGTAAVAGSNGSGTPSGNGGGGGLGYGAGGGGGGGGNTTAGAGGASAQGCIAVLTIYVR